MVSLLLLSLGGALWSTPRAAEPIIEEVRLEGNRTLSKEAFLALTDLKEGEPYDPEKIRREFQVLWDTGMFDDIRVDELEGTRGTIVVFVIQEKPRVERVEYEQNKVLNANKIEGVLEQNDLLIRSGSILNLDTVAKNRSIIKEMLKKEGYERAEVNSLVEYLGTTRCLISFTIDPGKRTRIRKIRFAGNTVFSDRQLKGMMRQTREHGMFSFVRHRDILYLPTLQDDLKLVRDAYLAKGFLDVRIGEAQTAPQNKKGKKAQYVDLEIPITEGEFYRAGAITIEGNAEFSDEELLPLIPFRTGDRIDVSLLRLGTSTIDNKYGNHGFIFVFTDYRFERHEDRTADVRITVSEDKKYYIRRIEFEGNSKTNDAVLRRELRVAEDDLFNKHLFQLGLRKVSQLGFFQIQQYPDIEPVDDVHNEVDITITGEESGVNEIRVGGGFSGLEGFFGTFVFSTRNFLGRGETLSASAQTGGRSTRFSLSFVEPYAFHTRYTLGASLFQRSLRFIQFRSREDGGGLSVFRPIKNFMAARVAYQFQNSKVTSSDFSSGTGAELARDSRTIASLTPSFIYDTRNNPFHPTRGKFASASVELSSGALGSDSEFVRPILRGTWYIPTLRRQFFALHGEAGWLENLEDEDIPIFEKFFLGGERSMRSFETRAISPKVFDDRGNFFDVGGTQYYLLNLEYAWTITSVLELAAFTDIGAAWGTRDVDPIDLLYGGLENCEGAAPGAPCVDRSRMPPGIATGGVDLDGDGIYDYQEGDFGVDDIKDPRITVGLELRFFTPIMQAPIRLIWGFNLSKERGEDTNGFQFSIGTTF